MAAYHGCQKAGFYRMSPAAPVIGGMTTGAGQTAAFWKRELPLATQSRHSS